MARHVAVVLAGRAAAWIGRGLLRAGEDGVRYAQGRRSSMKSVVWMIVACVMSAAVVSARFGREVWLGMLAPLAVVAASWLVMERVYRFRPQQLNSVMMAAFATKLVFFGVYVAIAIGVFGVRPIPFVLSLTIYFVALHLIEAILLKRLMV